MKRKVIIIIVLLLVVSLISIGKTFSKYVSTTKWDYSYNSKDFYFTSDYLSEEEKTLYYNSWDGSDISFNISNALNKDTFTNEDITYEVSCISNDTVCLINGESNFTATLTGGVYSNEKLNLSLSDFETVANVTVIARSIKPYKKTLQVTYEVNKETKINDIEYELKSYDNLSKLLINNNSDTEECVNIKILKDDIRVSKDNNIKNIKTNIDDVINSFDIVLNNNEEMIIDLYGNNVKSEDIIVSSCE
jgi:hypothetical protein